MPDGLYIVELHLYGLAKSVSYIPAERVLTTVYRLIRDQRSQLQYFKVKLYRILNRLSIFRLDLCGA